MPRIGLKDIPFPNRLDPWAMISNLKTAWENFRNIDRYTTVSAVAGTTVLTAISQTIFADATAGNITLTVPAATGNTRLTYTVFKTDLTTNTVTINGNVLGGNLGASRLTLVCDGTVYRLKDLYEEGTYTATLTGCTTSPTATVSYVRNGKSVGIKIGNLTATSNTTACTITGAPAHLFPTTAAAATPSLVNDNGLNHPGQIDISTGGVWTLSFYTTLTNLTPNFTNGGNKGLGATSFSYNLL